MGFRKAQSIFFLATAIFLLSASLFLMQDAGQGRLNTPEPARLIKPFFILEPDRTEINELLFYPGSPAPGDFLIIEAGPAINHREAEISFDFPGIAAPLYHLGGTIYTLIAISYEALPGSYEILVKQKDSGDIIVEKALEIPEKEFRLSRFSMPASRTEGWTAARLAEDREKVRKARNQTEPHPLWLQKFIHPLEGRITSEYGAIRIINDNPPRRHSGIDIGAEEGTIIISPNDGIIRLAEFLLSGGETVIIDHGMGLSSTYMHLHTIEAEVGQIIKRGEVIGTVGMTGYATGPHLHWEVNIGQNPVNPEQLLDNDLLWIPPAYVEELANRDR